MSQPLAYWPSETATAVRPSEQFRAKRSQRRSMHRIVAACVLLAIGGTFVLRCLPVVRGDSITSDETTHLTHIFHLLRNGDDLSMWELGAPRLPHLLGGAASYYALRSVGIFTLPPDAGAVAEVVLSGMPRVVVPARLVAVAWGLGLIGLVFWATWRQAGTTTGLIAAAMISLVPEVLAHSSIAGSDMPFTTSAFLALITLSRYVEAPSPGRWATVGLCVGLAWAMRHTGLVLLALVSAVHLVVAIRRQRGHGISAKVEAIVGSILGSLAMATLAFTVLWAGDGLNTISLGEVAGRSVNGIPGLSGHLNVANMPIPTSAVSILKQVRHQNAGHEAYFCGEFRQTGWPTYFPVAFLLKTPTGLLALFAIALATVKLARPTPWTAISLAFFGLLWLMLVRNKVNIGVRYALLTYPLAIPFVAQLFSRARLRDRIWGPLSIVALSWFAWASLGASGRFLSSFNEIGGGPGSGWIYLADSNLDWGQDLQRLTSTVDRLGLRELTVDVSTERRLTIPGVYIQVNPAKALQVPRATPANRRLYDDDGSYIPIYTRYVAVSASRLLGLYSQNDMSWLRTRRLVERVGDSIFLFDMDQPASEPLF